MASCLALLIFLNSVSYSIDVHYCQDSVASFSFWGKAKPCYQLADGTKDCTHRSRYAKSGLTKAKSGQATWAPPSCCKRKTLQHQLDEIPTPELSSLLDQSVEVCAQISAVSLLILEEGSQRNFDQIRYKPPPLTPDLRVLYESFLI